MRKGITGFFLGILLILVYGFPVMASEQGNVGISLEYGFKNNVKNGACLPLKVTLENMGKEFEGTLEMKVPVIPEENMVYSDSWFNADKWSNFKTRVYTYQKKLHMGEGEQFHETFYLELPMFDGNCIVTVKDGEQILGEEVINCNFSENTSRILMGIVSSDTESISKLDGMQVSFEQNYMSYMAEAFVKTIPLSAEEIYPNPEALTQLDLLIVDKGTAFTPEQQLALDAWIGDGGIYLERAGESIVDLFEEYINGEHREEFAKYLESMQTYTFGDTAGLSEVPVSRRPSMGKFLVILVVYVLIAGPGIYILLKKRKKLKYLWAGIGATSLIFLGIIWGLGKSTNIYAPFISYSGLYEQKNQIWYENVQMGIQAPYNNEYQLYLDNSYEFRPISMGTSGAKMADPQVSEQVNIRLGEENYKITMKNMAAFRQNLFNLKRNRRITEEEAVGVQLSGKDGKISGTWKNPTDYHLKNVILVMQNRAAVLGEMPAGSSGEFTDVKLHSFGNEGMELLMEDLMDFSVYEYPQYEKRNLANHSWSAVRESGNSNTNILAIVENPDQGFQLESGYKIHGTALFQMPVDVEWNDNGYLWCPNLETYGTSQNGEYSWQTNLIHGQEATVEYPLDFLGDIQKVMLSDVEYDEEKYFFSFQGNVAFYCWETGTFEEIQNWKEPLEGDLLRRYISPDNTIIIRYLVDNTLDTRNRSCMLPCLQAVGKVG